MQVKSVFDKEFEKYGKVIKADVPDLLKRLGETPLPENVVYVASSPELEACKEFSMIEDSNTTLNAVEYHRNSEINIPLTGAVLLVGMQQDVEADFTYDTAKMEAFEAPAGCVVELYATTLHYAPCNLKEEGFRVAIILPRGTNTEAPALHGDTAEDRLMTARNKWLIAHEESGLGAEGAFVGLKGENLKL